MNDRPKQKFTSIIGNNIAMLKRIAKYTPEYFALMIFDGVLWGFINASMAIYNYKLLNAVESSGDFRYALIIIGVMAVFNLFAFAFDKWYSCVKNPIMRQKLQLKIHSELFKKSMTLDLACFDDPEFYNDFVLAMEQSDTRAVEVLEDTGKLIKRIVGCSALFTVMLTIDSLMTVVLLISCCITMVCSQFGNKINFEHQKKSTPLWRKKYYINRVYRQQDYSQELRISHADEILQKEYNQNTEAIIKLDKKYGLKYFFLYGLGWTTVGIATYFILIVYMLSKLSSGALTVGALAASVNMVWSVRWQLNDLVMMITKYPLHSLFIEKFLEFMRFKPQLTGAVTDIPDFKSLEFRNVSFSYEFSSHPKYKFHTKEELENQKRFVKADALKNINLTINAGEKIAIVGYNGAGKTTLIKLILRLYDPTDGVILYNGVDVRKYDPVAYRKKLGAVFQDYKIFATSVAQNVMNGSCKPSDKATVLCALAKADFSDKLKKLPNGIDTHLTREFDEKGTNLSGGEQQKVAIARVFAADYPIIIMDEPSSALDPTAEYHLNRSVLKYTENKTVVFISHRLSTTRIADTIYMFDSGRLIECGSHNELLENGGKYAEMFNLQAEKYRNHCNEIAT